MEFEPKQKNKAPEMLTLALFFCALVCVVFGSIEGIRYRGILQSIAIILFAGMIYVLVKYKFTRVRYTVRKKDKKGYGSEDEVPEDGAPVLSCPPSSLELLIETAQGKRTFIGEALIPLDKITEVGKMPTVRSEKKALNERFRKTQKYTFLKNMVGADEYYLAAKTDVGDVKIVFEPNKKMADYLSAVARYNREQNGGDPGEK